ncbi:agmatine deiminase family protein [Francisella tularensis]|nr:agmatine deiminase family protein [Francisella tularensis]MWX68093.1 agmatine deiminase family protein [Francisella tularensis]
MMAFLLDIITFLQISFSTNIFFYKYLFLQISFGLTIAFEILQKCFKDRSIEQLNIIDLVIGGGGIHCITMQQPAIKEI